MREKKRNEMSFRDLFVLSQKQGADELNLNDKLFHLHSMISFGEIFFDDSFIGTFFLLLRSELSFSNNNKKKFGFIWTTTKALNEEKKTFLVRFNIHYF